jgi:hypothetical protein
MASVASLRRPSPPRLWSSPASAWINWPARLWQRVGLYLLFAIPLIGLAVWAEVAGYSHPELTLLLRRASLVQAGGADLSGLRWAYPPIPTLLSLMLPHNELSLAIVTSLCSAVILGYVTRRLMRRVSLAATVVLVLPLVAAPVMWYAASQLYAPVLSLAFLAVALDGYVKFTVDGETEGGFVAGLALAVSFLCYPGALWFVLVMSAYAPLLSHVRYQGKRSAAAIAGVLAFPTVGTAACWILLVWKFSGHFPDLRYATGAHPFVIQGSVAAALWQAVRSVGIVLLHVPLYFAAAALQYNRRPLAVFAMAMPIIALVLMLFIGYVYGPILSYLMFTIVALITISDLAQPRFERPLAVAALAQLVIVIVWPPHTDAFSLWVHTLI